MLSKYNITFKTLLPIILATIITFIIEAFRLVYSYTFYDMSIRDFEHLIAGIIVPYYLYYFDTKKKKQNSVEFSCVTYALVCFIWEFGQFAMRVWKSGQLYFQFDQFCYDLIGIAIIFLLFNFKNND